MVGAREKDEKKMTNTDINSVGATPNAPTPTPHGCCLHGATVIEHPEFEMPDHFAPEPPVTTGSFVPWSTSGRVSASSTANQAARGRLTDADVRRIRTDFANEITRLGVYTIDIHEIRRRAAAEPTSEREA